MIISSYDHRDDEWITSIINCSYSKMKGDSKEPPFGYEFISINEVEKIISCGRVTRESFNQFMIQDKSAKIMKRGKTESEYACALLLK